MGLIYSARDLEIGRRGGARIRRARVEWNREAHCRSGEVGQKEEKERNEKREEKIGKKIGNTDES